MSFNFFFGMATILFQKTVSLQFSLNCIFKFSSMKQIFQRGLLLLVLTIGLVFHLAAQSTLMTIYFNDGTERTYYMSEDDRVYFEDNETLVVEIAPTAKSERFNLADIRKITCSETEAVSEATSTPLWLSPNPVHDFVILHNLSGRQPVSIYALDGRVMKSLETTEGQHIDISDLPVGLYLVKIQSCILKMIKL